MKTWFTSDTHLGHGNIIEYCNRPFVDVEHMNYELIRRWNERVNEEDTVIHLGDFCFKNTAGGKEGDGLQRTFRDYCSELNGNIVLVNGNHDNNNSVKSTISGLELLVGGKEVYCVHNPEKALNFYDLCLVGHVHEKWKYKDIGKGLMINVGVDVWDYRPICWENIEKLISKINKKAGLNGC